LWLIIQPKLLGLSRSKLYTRMERFGLA